MYRWIFDVLLCFRGVGDMIKGSCVSRSHLFSHDDIRFSLHGQKNYLTSLIIFYDERRRPGLPSFLPGHVSDLMTIHNSIERQRLQEERA